MRNFGRCTLLLGALLLVSCAEEDGEETEELEQDAGASSAEDAGLDARADARVDARVDSSPADPDATEIDAADDPEPDASTLDAALMDAAIADASGDAGPDASAVDAGKDGGADAGKDGGADAGSDAGKDSGLPDASVIDASAPDASAPDASAPDASTPDASVPGTFSSVYLILSSNCTSCHGNSGSLSMANKQRAYDELVGGPLGPSMGLAEGPSCGGAGRRRVIAYDAANSLIIQKLSGSPPCGNAMPPGDDLPAASINEIRAWITAGALNN